jgi:rubredoxin
MENECPMCDGPPVLLGTLGRITWLRCRDCGWQYEADGPIGLDDEDDDPGDEPDDDARDD